MRLFILVLSLLPSLVFASGGTALMKSDNDLSNTESLQNGAKLFFNYCAGCHSLKFMRYNRMGKDLNITDEMLQENLMFTTDKIGSSIDIAMNSADAEAWFGTAVPDLSVVSRSRGVDWLYSYLMGFYTDNDESRPWGVNNKYFKDVGMPHVLENLQGEQKAEKGEHGAVSLHPVNEEDFNAKADAYKVVVRDIVNFLEYVGEPAKLLRQKIGMYVLAFLIFLMLPLAYLLKKEYWKDID
jgi:ubiquinol-cytochrome c reductase cytochrome c1 subunit